MTGATPLHAIAQPVAACMDIRQILARIPHRYPFVLVDRVLECVPGSHIRACKNVTFNEPFFQGHFPGVPIMPGVLIVEALAQAGALLAASATEATADALFLFTGIDGVRFRQQVIPGDRLELYAKILRQRLRLCKLEVQASVDGKTVAEGQLTAALADRA